MPDVQNSVIPAVESADARSTDHAAGAAARIRARQRSGLLTAGISRPIPAAIHIETTSLLWAEAVRRLGTDDLAGAAYHVRVACDNFVFAALQVATAERVPPSRSGSEP